MGSECRAWVVVRRVFLLVRRVRILTNQHHVTRNCVQDYGIDRLNLKREVKMIFSLWILRLAC